MTKRPSFAVRNEETYNNFVQSNPIIVIVHNPLGESSYERSACVARSSHVRNSQFDYFEMNPPDEGFEHMPTCSTSNSLIHPATHALNENYRSIHHRYSD